MRFIKTVPEGSYAPRGYGLAWRSFYKPEIYFAPMPFHLLIGWGRFLWQRFRYPRYAKLTEPELHANLRNARHEIAVLKERLVGAGLDAKIRKGQAEMIRKLGQERDDAMLTIRGYRERAGLKPGEPLIGLGLAEEPSEAKGSGWYP